MLKTSGEPTFLMGSHTLYRVHTSLIKRDNHKKEWKDGKEGTEKKE